jgi:hypothetical protein
LAVLHERINSARTNPTIDVEKAVNAACKVMERRHKLVGAEWEAPSKELETINPGDDIDTVEAKLQAALDDVRSRKGLGDRYSRMSPEERIARHQEAIDAERAAIAERDGPKNKYTNLSEEQLLEKAKALIVKVEGSIAEKDAARKAAAQETPP